MIVKTDKLATVLSIKRGKICWKYEPFQLIEVKSQIRQLFDIILEVFTDRCFQLMNITCLKVNLIKQFFIELRSGFELDKLGVFIYIKIKIS